MSRTPEQRSWDSFKASTPTARLKCLRVENAACDGMGDVIGQNRNGVTFWIENKALEAWPARAWTLPLKNAFEPGQLSFLRNWIQWGGHAFVLLRVARQYVLLNPLLELPALTEHEIMGTRIIMGKEAIVKHLEALQ